MATVSIDGTDLIVRLDRGEKIAGLRGDVRLPLAHVGVAEVAADPRRLLRGLRAPGLAGFGRRIGTWRSGSGRMLAVIRKGRPALRVELTATSDQPWTRLLIDVADPQFSADMITAATKLTAAESVRTAHGIEEPLAFRSAGHTLRGTLTRPAEGALPLAVLLITGSGRIDRDGDDRRLPIGLSRRLAQALADAGIASLRYDKRGVGSSEGDWYRTGLQDNIDDAAAALAALGAACPGCRLIPVGHSEGAGVATDLAARRDDLAGVVLLAGPAKTGRETLVWQAKQIAPSLPAPVRLLLKVLRTDILAKQAKQLARIAASTDDVMRLQGARLNAKWFREFMAFDPEPLLSRIGCPVLAITGDADVQVDADDLTVIASHVRGPVTTRRPPDVSHLLRRDPRRRGIRDYKRQVREDVDPATVADIVGWVRERSRGEHRSGA